MGQLTLFFDRNTGKTLPETLQRLKCPIPITYFNAERFKDDTPDDVWMATAGAKQWTVIGHDKKFHLISAEATAVKQHNLGCFYLARASGPMWDKCMLFMRAYDRMIELAKNTPRPFIYRVAANGRISRVKL